ncbi:unnamed protein product, partial [Durusdinium trenchii]
LLLHQELRGDQDPQVQKELEALSKRLTETEQASEQLSITLDTFWEEVAAISDLSQEMQSLGLRIGDLPDASSLKSLFGEWAWNLNCPVQLLFGSPLQCAGQFLVDVLKARGGRIRADRRRRVESEERGAGFSDDSPLTAACSGSAMQWISSKPLKLMGGSLLLKLVVPIIAHLAGNVDPNENAISHAFGQSSLCVAMDFPGWYEAALVVFLVAGLMDEYALFAVWWHFKEEWKASRGKVLGLHVLMVFLALCFGCFFMVSFWNPAASHDSNTVVAHTIPYLGLQLGYFTLALFVCLALPIEASTCQKVSLYVSLFLYLLLQVANLVVILWTFAELSEQAKSTLMNFLFGCGFATSAGRCTRGLYCSLMECEGRTLLILDTEGLMSLEAEGGGIFDAQLALMAMVIINHKGELSRQLQDLLEVCLFAMQHLKVCRIQPKLLFVLRDQHDRSQAVHGDALRLMRKHLAEASLQLSLRLDELISLDPGSVFLLPSAFASDLDHTGREVRWSTELFAQEAMQLRKKIFKEADQLQSCEAAPEFSTLPDWCLHAMSVWRVLDRYGPNLLHYKTIQEIELQRELEDAAKQISASLVRGKGGLAEECQALLASYKERLSQGESGEKVDAEFRSTLQAMLETCDKRAKAELERVFKARRSKLPDAQKDRPKSAFRLGQLLSVLGSQQEEAKKKLATPIEYQGELTRYTWSLCLADAVDRDQLRALKVHFKKTIEELWQVESSQSLAEQQARELFTQEWESFEEECRGRFARTSKSQKQLAEEVCMVFNHVLRQHRHGDEALHVLELVPSTGLLGSETFVWEKTMNFLELRSSSRTANETEMIRNHVARSPGLPTC